MAPFDKYTSLFKQLYKLVQVRFNWHHQTSTNLKLLNEISLTTDTA